MFKYRREIDGLRAVAVIPVILCHAGVEFLKGGFLGVDVFFVISGYLITSLIDKDIQAERFSIFKFYERRARRLMPALFVVLAATALGALYILPEDLENLGQSFVATIAFSNNILLYLTSGYWAMEVDFKPLAHTWSLGVEEQYYILAPIIMMAAFPFGRRVLCCMFALILIMSLLFSQFASQSSPEFAFLMIFTRAWELAIGALVALILSSRKYGALNSHRFANLLTVSGLILILVSMLVFNEDTRHPSLLTLFPVMGTVLILVFANTRQWAGRFLAISPLVGIGLISYSAYLWHQPIFSYARLFSLDPPGLNLMLLLSGLTIFISYLSWRYVEQPFRGNSKISNKLFIPGVVAGCLCFGSIGLWWHSTSGLVHRYAEIYSGGEIKSQMNRAYTDQIYALKRDTFEGMQKEKNLLVVGQSFARDFVHMGLENQYFSNYNVVYLDDRDGYANPQHQNLFQQSDVVVFATNYGRDSYIQLMQFIESIKPVTRAEYLVTGTKNFGWNNNAVMLLDKEKRYEYQARVLDEVVRENQHAKEIIPQDMYIDLLSLLGMKDGRIPVFTPDKKLISQDRRHFTQSGAKHAGLLVFEDPRLRKLK